MRLKECQSLWGNPISHLREHSKKYRLFSSILYVADIIIILALTYLLYSFNLDFKSYGFVIIIACLFVHFITLSYLNPDKWEAFKFYRKNMKYRVDIKSYKVDSDNLYSILYCIAFKRLKQGKSFETYKELILSACCENTNNSKSLMKYMRKYEDVDGNLSCYVLTRGKTQYFIDFYDEEEEANGDVESGDVEESSSEDID